MTTGLVPGGIIFHPWPNKDMKLDAMVAVAKELLHGDSSIYIEWPRDSMQIHYIYPGCSIDENIEIIRERVEDYERGRNGFQAFVTGGV